MKVKTAEFHTIVTRHLEWFKRKNMRQTIGRPAPVPNPMTFLFEPLLVKIYTQICARLHRDSAAPFGIRSRLGAVERTMVFPELLGFGGEPVG